MTHDPIQRRWNALRDRMMEILDRPGAPTQTELGKRPDITQSSLSRFLSGKAEVLAMDTIAAFADATGTTVGALWGEDASGGDNAGLVIKTYSALTESLINPRGKFDEDALQELKASIAAHGVLQNLVITPGTKQDVIVAGARRHRAIGLLVKEKAVIAGVPAGNYPIPCRVIQANDIEQRLLAITENLQRDDIAPIDEARAYVWLRNEARWSTEQIAERIHKTQRYVQKRITLVERLGSDAQTALADNKISLAAAQALTIAEPAKQQEAVTAVVEGRHGWQTAADIRRHLTYDMPEVGEEVFPIDRYTGEIVEGDGDARHFADVALYERLQREAAEAKVVELAENWNWVEFHDATKDGQFRYWDFDKSDNKATAGCVVEIDEEHGVFVHEGLVKPKPASASTASGTDAPKTPKPHFSQKHLGHAKHVKTHAMQRAVADNPGAALRLCVLGLLGGDVARVTTGRADYGDSAAIDPEVRKKQILIFPKLAGKVATKSAVLGTVPLAGVVSSWQGEHEDAVWSRLHAMTDAEVLEILAAIMAAQVGTWAGYNPAVGDAPAACAVAADLGVDMTSPAKAQLAEDDYLKSAGKAHLIEIIADNDLAGEIGNLDKMTQKAMRQKLIPLVEAGRLDGYVPRELRFGSEEKLAKAALKANKSQKTKEAA